MRRIQGWTGGDNGIELSIALPAESVVIMSFNNFGTNDFVTLCASNTSISLQS